jgi:hypothetical protein
MYGMDGYSETTVEATKVCSGHLGKQLAATRKDGRPYTCAYGKDCTFVHMSIAGKSNQKLLEVATTMPPPMKQDISRAINSRKCLDCAREPVALGKIYHVFL